MKNNYRVFIFIVLVVAIAISIGMSLYRNNYSKKYKEYKDAKVKVLEELNTAHGRYYWIALTEGRAEDWIEAESAERQITHFLSDSDGFQYFQDVYNSGAITDPVDKRELQSLYLAYKRNSGDIDLMNEITNLSTSIGMRFNTYRTQWEGMNLTDNEVTEILQTSTNSTLLEQIWTAQKAKGPLIAKDLIRLVKLRNQLAKNLGHENYHTMSLILSEQDPEEVNELFDWVHQQTILMYMNNKRNIDLVLTQRYNVTELKPWHYQDLYFQKLPKVFISGFDDYYINGDLAEITTKFYESIGLPIDDIMRNSDLYPRKGKSQHGFCMNIDNNGNIRVLSNNANNEKWMGTMLHEFGHAAYEKYVSRKLPYLLRQPAHIFTTEAVAMLFQRSALNPNFIKHFFSLKNENVTDLKKNVALDRLIFTRWALVMYHFERQMYKDPDQDLDDLWWRLVEKYQKIKGPQTTPDWANKIHFTMSPCYYHNYLLGELLASQLNHYIVKKVMNETEIIHPEFYGRKEVGEYLKNSVFNPGSFYKWDELILKATGKKLKGEYYLNEIFIGLGLSKGLELD